MTRRRWLPENVTHYRDRHGKLRYRFRKKGVPTYHFRYEPGTTEFMEEYRLARDAVAEPLPRFAPFTYDALIASFYDTPRWKKAKPSTRRTYGGIIERFRATNGGKDVRGVTAAAIEAKLAKMADTPSAANNLRKVLSRLHRHAIKLDWRKDNPVTATDAFVIEGDGHHTWTEDEIAKYEARWPIGTKERLAFALLLYTGLRLSDMLTVGRQHLRGGRLELHHTKNNSDTSLRIITPLAEAIAAHQNDHLTYITTVHGKPYTPKGFGNWFRRKCDEAGLAHCSAHGLRKAMARRLAESGSTNQQGKAVTGHHTDKLFTYYARQADQGALSDEAMANLERKFANKGGKCE